MTTVDLGSVAGDGDAVPAGSGRRIPLWLKIVYSLFVAVMAPYYWRTYTPWNFLYFCDMALLLTAVAIWTESRLLVSMSSVAILAPQAIWVADILCHLCGFRLLGMTDYMFDPGIPLFVRGLSSFHGWLPFLLVYLLYKLGYDRRALPIQTCVGLTVLLFCYFVAPRVALPDRPNMAVNINYVWGMHNQPQTAMMPGHWLALLCTVCVLGFYVPTHLVLRWLVPDRSVFAGPRGFSVLPPRAGATHREPG